MADNLLSKVAVRAVRLAAMSQLGPLAGAAFFGGGAFAAKVLAQSETAKAAADVTDGLGDHHEALKQTEPALDILRKKLPAQHPHIRTVEDWRAIILKRLGS